MRGVVLAAIFGFVLALGLAVAARRAVVASLVVVFGAGWAATLAGNAGALAAGVAILAAVLVVLAGLTTRRVPRAALPVAAALALLALLASSSPAVAKHELVAWQRWDFSGSSQAPVSVSYVWNGQYEGIQFAPRRTTVLEVKAPARSLYWRAALLDDFAGDRWLQGAPRAGDSLEPPASRDPREPGSPGGDGEGARRHAARRRRRARRVRGRRRAARPSRAGARVSAVGSDARLPLHGLELRAAADVRRGSRGRSPRIRTRSSRRAGSSTSGRERPRRRSARRRGARRSTRWSTRIRMSSATRGWSRSRSPSRDARARRTPRPSISSRGSASAAASATPTIPPSSPPRRSSASSPRRARATASTSPERWR